LRIRKSAIYERFFALDGHGAVTVLDVDLVYGFELTLQFTCPLQNHELVAQLNFAAVGLYRVLVIGYLALNEVAFRYIGRSFQAK